MEGDIPERERMTPQTLEIFVFLPREEQNSSQHSRLARSIVRRHSDLRFLNAMTSLRLKVRLILRKAALFRRIARSHVSFHQGIGFRPVCLERGKVFSAAEMTQREKLAFNSITLYGLFKRKLRFTS